MNADRNPLILWQALQELVEESDEFSKDLEVKLIGKCAGEIYKSIENHNLKDKVSFVGLCRASGGVKTSASLSGTFIDSE